MPENILDIVDKFDLFLLDMYGVLWNGGGAVPGAFEHAAELRRLGKTVIVLSNSADNSDFLVEAYANRGLIKGTHYDEVFSSGDLAQMVFSGDERALKFYPYGKWPEYLFEHSRYVRVDTPEEADFIYLGVPKILKGGSWCNVTDITPFRADLEKFCRLQKPVVCPNPDCGAQSADFAVPVIRQGALAAYCEQLGGKVSYFGKPHPELYQYVLQDSSYPKYRTLMVGDTLQTDILGAIRAGIKSALVCGGISDWERQAAGIADMEAFAASRRIFPDYYLKSL